jgi:hypothetical protein
MEANKNKKKSRAFKQSMQKQQDIIADMRAELHKGDRWKCKQWQPARKNNA